MDSPFDLLHEIRERIEELEKINVTQNPLYYRFMAEELMNRLDAAVHCTRHVSARLEDHAIFCNEAIHLYQRANKLREATVNCMIRTSTMLGRHKKRKRE